MFLGFLMIKNRFWDLYYLIYYGFYAVYENSERKLFSSNKFIKFNYLYWIYIYIKL